MRLRSLDPLLIAAPVQRCGTTLLQRLLSSSPEALIFGESLAHDLDLLVALLNNKRLLLADDGGDHRRQMERVLVGDVNEWIADLLPGGEWVLEEFERTVTRYLGAYAEFAAARGRARWGAKAAGWQSPMLAQVLTWLPEARLLYIVRDLESAVRSARLIGLCQDHAAIEEFARAWLGNQQLLRQLAAPERTLWVDYQALCREPEETLDRIETFCGLSGIDLSVLEHRVNSDSGTYLPPPALDDEARALLASYAPVGQ